MIYLFLTNRLDWECQADPRVLSFLKKTDIMFEPYDAMDLQEILKLRVEKALDSRKVDQGAIEKIAGIACRETGDARKAIELLARAVRVAEEDPGTLTETEVDVAESLLEEDKTQTLFLLACASFGAASLSQHLRDLGFSQTPVEDHHLVYIPL